MVDKRTVYGAEIRMGWEGGKSRQRDLAKGRQTGRGGGVGTSIIPVQMNCLVRISESQ